MPLPQRLSDRLRPALGFTGYRPTAASRERSATRSIRGKTSPTVAPSGLCTPLWTQHGGADVAPSPLWSLYDTSVLPPGPSPPRRRQRPSSAPPARRAPTTDGTTAASTAKDDMVAPPFVEESDVPSFMQTREEIYRCLAPSPRSTGRPASAAPRSARSSTRSGAGAAAAPDTERRRRHIEKHRRTSSSRGGGARAPTAAWTARLGDFDATKRTAMPGAWTKTSVATRAEHGVAPTHGYTGYIPGKHHMYGRTFGDAVTFLVRHDPEAQLATPKLSRRQVRQGELPGYTGHVPGGAILGEGRGVSTAKAPPRGGHQNRSSESNDVPWFRQGLTGRGAQKAWITTS
jgi:hypothetical protein